MTVLLSHRYWLLFLSAYLFLRIICLRRPVVFAATLVALGMTAAGSYYYLHTVQEKTLIAAQDQETTLLVQADEIQINGLIVHLVGQDVQSGVKETAVLIVRQPADLQKIRSLTTTSYWRVKGVAQPLLPATNENQFDSCRFYRQRHIYNQLKIKQVIAISTPPQHNFIYSCHNLRAVLIKYFKKMPQPLGGYCQQLLVGQSDPAIKQTMQDVKKLGIIHLFCISGMHVFLLVAIIKLGCTFLWLDREIINIILMIILPFYLVIAGGAISIVRAVIMAEAGLLGRLLKVDSLDGWAISLLIGLAVEPELLLSLGGQLSYTLSFILQVLTEVPRFWQSILLSLVSLPAILTYTFEFHCLSLILSWPMIPLFSFAIFPSVLVSAATFGFLPFLAYLTNDLLVIYQRLLGWLAQCSGEIHFGKPPVFCALLLFLATLWCIQDFRKRHRWIILAGLYSCCFLFIHYPINGEVTFVDIGQGDCIIIRQPFNRQVTMIDTGGKLQFGRPLTAYRSDNDIARQTSINYLKSKGISHLSTIYLSHHDVDHIGYLPTVMEEMQVDKIVVPAGMEKQSALMERIQGNSQARVIPVTDQTISVDRELKILHPFAPGEAKNEDSLVLAGCFNGVRFLFTGDLDRDNERKVVEKYPNLRTDVLKLGHHGSKTASDPVFLQRLRPQLGIISAGRFNRYHHPSDEVVASLKQQNILPVSTQQYGMISYFYGPYGGHWETKLKGDELKWTLPNCLNN